MTQYKAASDEVVLYTHLTGIVYLLIICVGSKEMGEGLAFTFERFRCPSVDPAVRIPPIRRPRTVRIRSRLRVFDYIEL